MSQELFELAPEPLRTHRVSVFAAADADPLRNAPLIEGFADFIRFAIEDRTDPNVVTFKITTFGRQYTLQNEALAPWFLRLSPSFSVNGYYTYLGPIDFEFTHPAPACGPQ